jgi:hypothetical protein
MNTTPYPKGRPLRRTASPAHLHRIAMQQARAGHAARRVGNLVAARRYFALASILEIRAARMLPGPAERRDRMILQASAETLADLANFLGDANAMPTVQS